MRVFLRTTKASKQKTFVLLSFLKFSDKEAACYEYIILQHNVKYTIVLY